MTLAAPLVRPVGASLAGAAMSTGVHLVRPNFLARAFTTSRASAGWAFDGGVLREYGDNVPRLTSEGLVIEGQRTNMVADARTVFGTGWTNTGIAGTTAITGPDGVAGSALRVNEGTSVSGHNTFPAVVTFVSGTSYSFSAIMRANTCSTAQIVAGSVRFGADVFGNFDLAAGVVGTAGAAVTRHVMRSLSDGWWWCEIVAPATSTGTTGGFTIALTETASAVRLPSYTGTSRLLDVGPVWTEDNSLFASTVILPPIGAPAASTRLRDAINGPPATFNTAGGGAFYGRVTIPALVTGVLLGMNDGTNSNRWLVEANVGGAFNINRVNVGASATTTNAAGQSYTAGVSFGIAVRFASDGIISLSVNGANHAARSGAPLPPIYNNIILGETMWGIWNQLRFRPGVVSDAELRALSSFAF